MTFDPDDPRLTAYALGELEGDEHAAVESLLAESDDARRLVDEVRETARLLAEHLGSEAAPALSEAQRRAIASELERPSAVLPFRMPWARLALAASALIAATAGLYAWSSNRSEPGMMVTLNDAPAGAIRSRAAPAAPESAPPPPMASPLSVDEAPALASAPSDPGVMSAPALVFPEAARGAMAAGSPAAPPAPSGYFLGGQTAGMPPSNGPAITAMRGMGGMPGSPAAGALFDGVAPPVPPASVPAPADPTGVRSSDHLAAAPASPDGSRIRARRAIEPGAMAGLSGQPAQPSHAGRTETEGLLGQARGADFAMRLGDQPSQAANQGEPAQQGHGGRPLGRQAQAGQQQDPSQGVLPDGGQKPAGHSKTTTNLGLQVQPEPLAKQKSEAYSRAERPLLALRERVEEREVKLDRPTPLEAKPEPEQEPLPDQNAILPRDQEEFARIVENEFEPVTPGDTFSTFSVDVDTASYAVIRRDLNAGFWPAADAVRIEEMVNYFDYDYPAPSPADEVPFAVATELIRCPWNPEHDLLRIGIQGQSIDFSQRKPSNLVFLVDVSGSMNQPDKLPLVKAGLRMLAEQLGENDSVAMVVYAGNAGLVLPATRGDKTEEVVRAIDRLEAGGSTNGGAGIELAYKVAAENFRENGINRVILATDGDFNTGLIGADAVADLAAEKAKAGVFLSVLGVGSGNLKDATMEKVADRGNGNYFYLDSLLEARRVLVEQVGGTLVTIAKDVKIQVDFNPSRVGAYRLIGYEDRVLADRDFADDTKDAGEIGSNHSVTALYEIVRPGEQAEKLAPRPEPSKYVKAAEPIAEAPVRDDKGAQPAAELLNVRLRYKTPDGTASQLVEHPVPDRVLDLGEASADTKFAAAVAEFGLILRSSKFKGQATLAAARELAGANLGADASGRRGEFVELVEKAESLKPR